jgi:hypothetical protein
MATETPELPPIPPPNIPIIDPQTGLANEYWYRWLKLVEQIVRGLRTEV